ncbi:DUF7224 domain-containing protein [Streptomyces sp. DT193]|uniref:DUF7224 domain-containing protein n=1 Tax=Streptomyces sp. DT193 TaxID=3393418 RepID=UPI003CF47405
MTYAFAYAVASGLSAWESGTLRSNRVFELGSVRSRLRIAAEALTPVLGLSWLMLTLPPLIALLQTATFPTLPSLLPLGMALVVCVAHCVIGFTAGMLLPRLVAGPLMTVATWVLVAFSASTTPFWLRHVSGQYPEYLMFGEQATLSSLAPHIMLSGGIALALCALWLPAPSKPLRLLTAGVVSTVCCVTAVSMAHGWDYNPPLAIDKAPMQCAGVAPRICMPEATSDDLAAVRRSSVSILTKLKASGGPKMPTAIIDDITTGRMSAPSTATRWRVGLTAGARAGDLKYRILAAATHFPCSEPDLTASREVRLWAATVTGQIEAYNRRNSEEAPFPGEEEVSKHVDDVLRLSKPEQGQWFRHHLTSACHEAS